MLVDLQAKDVVTFLLSLGAMAISLYALHFNRKTQKFLEEERSSPKIHIRPTTQDDTRFSFNFENLGLSSAEIYDIKAYDENGDLLSENPVVYFLMPNEWYPSGVSLKNAEFERIRIEFKCRNVNQSKKEDVKTEVRLISKNVKVGNTRSQRSVSSVNTRDELEREILNWLRTQNKSNK